MGGGNFSMFEYRAVEGTGLVNEKGSNEPFACK